MTTETKYDNALVTEACFYLVVSIVMGIFCGFVGFMFMFFLGMIFLCQTLDADTKRSDKWLLDHRLSDIQRQLERNSNV